MFAPSTARRSILGFSRQDPQRRSSPNHDTTSEAAPQFGTSSRSCASEVTRSVSPEGELRLAGQRAPGRSDR